MSFRHSLMSLLFSIFFQQYNYCKVKGAHIGCCSDTASDAGLSLCSKKYHDDCGIDAGASFTISKGTGTVSICYQHRDPNNRNTIIFEENDTNEDNVHIEYLEIEYLDADAIVEEESTKNESFNLSQLNVSLDDEAKNQSSVSDCIITDEYTLHE